MWLFKNKKKEFVNRLKYGRKDKIDYSVRGIEKALGVGDEELAATILNKLIGQK